VKSQPEVKGIAMPDFLDEVIQERQKKNPSFGAMVAAAVARRRLLRDLAEARVALGLSQTMVAAEMGTSQSSVARIESGDADLKLSTLERYASTLGMQVEWRIVTARPPKASTHKRTRAS
jgi:ribosome-binding protein aMBF1 (putative translation factor)